MQSMWLLGFALIIYAAHNAYGISAACCVFAFALLDCERHQRRVPSAQAVCTYRMPAVRHRPGCTGPPPVPSARGSYPGRNRFSVRSIRAWEGHSSSAAGQRSAQKRGGAQGEEKQERHRCVCTLLAAFARTDQRHGEKWERGMNHTTTQRMPPQQQQQPPRTAAAHSLPKRNRDLTDAQTEAQ
jgi:hypothetical protein